MHDHPLAGIVVPIVTPMSAPGVVDLGSLDGYLDALARMGVTRIMAFGSNGEGATLSDQDCIAVIKVVLARWSEVTDGQVLAAVVSPSTTSALRRATVLRAAGVRNLVVSPPIFFRHTADEIVAHFAEFASFDARVGAYDNRRYSGNPLTSEVVRELVGMPHMIGIKDSSGSLDNLRANADLGRQRDDFVISQGDDREIVAAFRVGARGATAGAANLLPRVALDLWEHAQRGDFEAASVTQELLRRVGGIHAVRPGIVSTKYALATRGLIHPHASLPFLPLTSREQAEVGDVLAGVEDHLIGGDVS